MVLAAQGEAGVMWVSLKGRKFLRGQIKHLQTAVESHRERFKQRHEIGLNNFLETYHSSFSVEDKLDCNKIGGPENQLRSCFTTLIEDWQDRGNKMEMEGQIWKYLEDVGLDLAIDSGNRCVESQMNLQNWLSEYK